MPKVMEWRPPWPIAELQDRAREAEAARPATPAEIAEAVAERLTSTSAPVEDPTEPGVWLTPDEAAEYLGISRRSIERRAEDTPPGVRSPRRKIGGSVRWKRDSLDDWVSQLDAHKKRRRTRRKEQS